MRIHGDIGIGITFAIVPKERRKTRLGVRFSENRNIVLAPGDGYS